MDGYTWYVISQKQEDGKQYAFPFRIRNNVNIASFVLNMPTINTMNPCNTKKKAVEIATAWNETYKVNGTYLYDGIVIPF